MFRQVTSTVLGCATPTLTPLQEALFFLRVLYDLSFFFLVIIIIIQNLIFGVIIDTFADLRSEKNKKEYQLKNTCFICGEYQWWRGGGVERKGERGGVEKEGRKGRSGEGREKRGVVEREGFCRQMYTFLELSLAVLNSTITQCHAYQKYTVRKPVS